MTPDARATPAWDAFAAPVALQTCRVELNIASGDDVWGGYPLIAGVEVRFVNHSSATATEVVFRIRTGNLTLDVPDRGKFSPGVPIDVIFSNFAGRDYWRPEPDICRVVSVRFADGTAWQAGPSLR